MIGRWAIVVCAASCGRVAFEPQADSGVAPAMFDRDFTRSEFADLILQRGTIATYVDANGVLRTAAPNEPRFDHVASTGEPLGLLVEQARANFLIGSADLEVSPWFNNGAASVMTNVALAPDGSLTAEAVVDADSTQRCRWAQGQNIVDDTDSYSFSVFVKAGTRTTMSFSSELLGGAQTVQPHMTVDLMSGAITTTPGPAVAWGAEPWPNGWYRIWMTLANNGTGNNQVLLSVWSDWDNDAALGTIFAWGAQVERGAFMSSYIPTPATGSLTRMRDIVTSDASWLAADRGTLRARASINGALAED